MDTRTFTLTIELPANTTSLVIEPFDKDEYVTDEEYIVDVAGIWESEDKARAESLKATNPSET